MDIQIREALEDEAESLSDIRVRSKGHWGYSREVLEAWRPAMVITREYIQATIVRSIFVEGRLVGFYAIKKEEGLLEHLWLLPEVIGRGVGKYAFMHAVEKARSIGLSSIMIISDADAEGFYLKLGSRRIGDFFSPHQNRLLPKLVYTISGD